MSRIYFLLSVVTALLLSLSAGAQPTPEKPMLSHFAIELPHLQCPISLIIDDPTPIFTNRPTAEEIAKRKAQSKGADWWTFFDNLVNLFADFGVKGKFTVNTYRSEVGMIDKITDPARKRQLDEFLTITQKRIVPAFDITPEIISHGVVLNVETDQPLGVKDPEHIWSQTQDEDTLEKYIGRGLLALKNVGLHANGVTSPCDFGSANEANYVRAIHRALKRVNGVKLAWYFLQADSADYVEPRLMYFDRRNAEYVVSIMPTSRTSDIGLNKTHGRDIAKLVDTHITADGKAGVFPKMIANRSYIVFYKHWGLLYDEGHETGVKVLREVFTRMKQHYADDVRWMTCSDIARYYAAGKTLRLTQHTGQDSVSLRLESPIPCPGLTVSFSSREPVQKISVDGKTLTRLDQKPKHLPSATWCPDGARTIVCLDLADSTKLEIHF